MMSELHGSLEPGYSVTRRSPGEYDLKVWGRMPIGWIGNLTGGVAGSGLSIERGSVQKTSTYSWEAGFEMRPVSLDAMPERIDYMKLARQVAGGTMSSNFTLESFTLREPFAPQDPLYLEVRAADQTGFLGALLNRLAFFSLFPESMSIDTIGGKINDRFWLKSPGGQSPSDEVVGVLRKALSSRIVS